MNWHLIWRSDLTYQIKCQFWQQLNWPIWQWSDNWIDQFDNADHITNIAKIDTWFDTSDLIVKSSVNSISKIIISYYEKISNWIDIDLILNWPIWPKQIDTLLAEQIQIAASNSNTYHDSKNSSSYYRVGFEGLEVNMYSLSSQHFSRLVQID